MEIEISRELNNKTIESLLLVRCQSVSKKNNLMICTPKAGKLVTIIRFLTRNRIPYRLMAELHEGTITADSKPGEYAVFEESLPLNKNVFIDHE